MKNYKQVKAIEASNKKRLLSVNPNLNENSGIYFLTRVDENGIKYAYIGQVSVTSTEVAVSNTVAKANYVDGTCFTDGTFYFIAKWFCRLFYLFFTELALKS